ncbi:MAG TPA: hypothetical protein EYH17_02090 [Pyrodictium sp.]|nr:hypothetical protein [Pyrodictium sp.]
MAVEALATALPFIWALPLLVAAYKLYTQGRMVSPVVLLALALSIMAGVLIPELTVKYAVSWSIAMP